MPDYIDEKTIRKRVIKRMEEQQGLMIHAVAFVIGNLMIWFVLGTLDVPLWIAALATGGWGIGMFAHFMDYWTNYGGGAIRREEQIRREIERERERLSGVYEKPKNDLTLGEDGELFYGDRGDDYDDYDQDNRQVYGQH